MARKSTFVPDTTGPQRVALEDIPDDIKKYVEEVYARQRKTPGREHVEYDTVKELENEFKLMVDYAAQRPGGILKVRKSPTRGLKDNVMEFRVTADTEANGQANAGPGAAERAAAQSAGRR